MVRKGQQDQRPASGFQTRSGTSILRRPDSRHARSHSRQLDSQLSLQTLPTRRRSSQPSKAQRCCRLVQTRKRRPAGWQSSGAQPNMVRHEGANTGANTILLSTRSGSEWADWSGSWGELEKRNDGRPRPPQLLTTVCQAKPRERGAKTTYLARGCWGLGAGGGDGDGAHARRPGRWGTTWGSACACAALWGESGGAGQGIVHLEPSGTRGSPSGVTTGLHGLTRCLYVAA